MAFEKEKEVLLSGVPSGVDHRYRLTSLALLLVLAAIIGIFILLAAKEFDGSASMPNISKIMKNDSTLNKESLDSLARQYQLVGQMIHEEKKDYREFFLKICQMILLNLLLPILTAILGYKVGVNKND